MINIGIVDDNEQELSMIHNLIKEELDNHETVTKIECFNDPHDIDLDQHYDIFFLDIDMQINGIEFAKDIQDNNSNCIIVFITNRHDKVFDSFQVHPYDFIKKHELKTHVKPMIEGILNIIDIDNLVINVRTKEGTVKVNSKNIKYIESINHRCIIHTSTNEITSWCKLANFEMQLVSLDFFRIHQSFIINWNYVSNYQSSSLMIDDKEFPISRSKIKEAKKSRLEHLSRKI